MPVAVIRIAPATLPAFDPTWKDKCLSCTNVRQARSRAKDPAKHSAILRCAIKAPHLRGYRGDMDRSAISMRMSNELCGPSASLWEAA